MKINKESILGLNPNSNLVKQYKKSLIKLTKEQKEASRYALGLMLGDASLQTQNRGKTYRMKFEWGNKNKAYLNHVYFLYDDWVLSEPHKKVRISPNNNEVINWGFQTISHEAFNFLADLFLGAASLYQALTRGKLVPKNLILYHLTPRGLAYWFMDDGGKLDYNKGSKNQSIVLNTHSFTELEVKNMTEELSHKFNLDCSIRKNKGKYIIIIKSDSRFALDTFYGLIKPYIIEEMVYKLPIY
jgi:hypothetical protein